MPISFRCPGCAKAIKVRDELAGKQAKCICGTALRIPGATPLKIAKGARRPARPLKQREVAARKPRPPAKGAAASGVRASAAKPARSAPPRAPAAPAPPAAPVEQPLAPSMSSFLDEALSEPLPTAVGPIPPAQRPATPASRPAISPRYDTRPVFGGDYDRPRRGNPPSGLSRALIGGFMTFVGGVGVVGFFCFCLLMLAALSGMASGLLGKLPVGSAVILNVVICVLLVIGIAALFGSYCYLSGGIGILQGKVEGADKGATGSGIFLAMAGIQFCLAFILVMIASGSGNAPPEAAGAALGEATVKAILQSIIPAAILWWCKTVGQRLPR
jgi:hypothetical protein